MFRRSPSRPPPRLFRSSSPRNHQRKGCVFACIGALLLLSTVAFLHAKRGGPQAAQHNSSDNVNFHRRFVTDVPRDGGRERDRLGSKTYDTLRKGFEAGLEVSDSNVDEHNVKSFDKEENSFYSKASEQLDERKAGNGSFVYRQEDYDNDDADDDDNYDEKLDLDTGTDVELEADEMDDLEDPGDIAAEELDDMDEDDGNEDEEANEQVAEVEKLERKEVEINEELENETLPSHQDSEDLLAAVTGNASTLEIHDGQENSGGNFPQRSAENTRYEQEAATEHTSRNGFQRAAHTTKALERLGGVKTVPRWDPLEDLNNVGLHNSARDSRGSFVQGYEMDVSLRNDGIIWDHLLGVARRRRRRTGNIKPPSVARRFELGAADEISKLESLSAAVRERQGGFSNGSSSGRTQVFSSDDEPLDEVIRERLEEVTAIEDALLLRTSKGDANKKERSSKASFDPLNPSNNPLLQDPDTFGPNGLTKSDKAIWKAIRKAGVEKTTFLQEKSGEADGTSTTEKESVSTPESHEALAVPLVSGANIAERSILGVLTKSRNLNSWNLNTEKTDLQQQSRLVTMVDPRTSIEMKGGVKPTKLSQDQGEETLLTSLLNNPVNVLFEKEEGDIAAPKLRNNEESEQQMVKFSDIKYPKLQKPTEIRASDSQMDIVHQLQHMDSERAIEMTMQREAGSGETKHSHKKHHLAGGGMKWGFFPGIDPFSSFSEFLEQFLMDSRCSLRVFMAWTTPPWTYTVRYQRGLESLLHFHSQACIVVFSESIELNFFTSFIEDGFRVAVVVPNLEELLKGTPADVFASVWLTWRKTDLFHIHYTELLRLAALYKYGGIYIDTDVIILKPLDILHNTIGAENIENHRQRMNGAVMAFDKFSPFLLECLAEFTATYDDRLVEFNGAELLTRVADRTAGERNKKLEQLPGVLNIKLPHAFFPLSSGNITTYFMAPVNQQQDWEYDQILKMIFNQSLAVHFWNQRTSRLVPEVGSLVERVINHYCIRCNEYL